MPESKLKQEQVQKQEQDSGEGQPSEPLIDDGKDGDGDGGNGDDSGRDADSVIRSESMLQKAFQRRVSIR